MRLGYFCYASGGAQLARFVLYHSEQPIDVFFEGLKFTSFAPMISVGPVISQAPHFTLVAQQHGQLVGICRGTFVDGSVLPTDCAGVFMGLLVYELIERETIQAVPFGDCPGLPPTDIMLLSRKWEGYQLIVGKKGVGDWDVEYWDGEEGVCATHWVGRSRCTGWSTRYNGSAAPCSVALVAVLSGKDMGKAGWLLMGDEAGLQIGGALGDITCGLWVPSLDDFPGRISNENSKKYIGLPPVSVTGELKGSTENAVWF